MATRQWPRTWAALVAAGAMSGGALDAQAARTTTRRERALVWTVDYPGGIRHTVQVAPISPAQGEHVEFTSIIKNTGLQPIELDVEAELSVGGDLRLDVPPYDSSAVVRRLRPGESLTRRLTGVVRSPPGTYTVTVPSPVYAIEGKVEVREPR